MQDLFGKALLDFQANNYSNDIVTHSSLEEEAIMPLPYLFRNYDEMPLLEQKSLQLCQGKVLDIGCGTGGHSLWLQENGFDITGLDSSKGAIEVCDKRGVKKTIHCKILEHSGIQYDTLLLLMNGIGVAGKLKNLSSYLNHLKSLLSNRGQILLDSSDIIYMFEQDNDGGYWIPGNVDYYGEVEFQIEYKGEKGPIFDWLYLDFNTLKAYAEETGLKAELMVNGEHYNYLAKLTLA